MPWAGGTREEEENKQGETVNSTSRRERSRSSWEHLELGGHLAPHAPTSMG